MYNVLMEFCRSQHKLSKGAVAKSLKISLDDYNEIITGKALLSPAQARALGKLYNAPSSFFYTASVQLDHYLSTIVVMDALKSKHSALMGSQSEGIHSTEEPVHG
jgi:hypothetical protein